jgi:DNA polymerase-3 subunit beta
MSKPQTMKLKMDRATLVKELAYVCKAVPSNPTIPVLGCVHISTDANSLHLRTTNMDLTLTAALETVEVAEDGAVCVSAKRLAKILGEMTDAAISLSANDKNEVEVSGAACKFKLLGVPEDDFPVTATASGDPIKVKGSVLADAVSPVLHAVCTDETRFVLNSVYLQLDKAGEILAVSTDGKRLAKCGGNVAPDAVTALVPTDAARLLVTLADAEEVIVLVGAKVITVRSGEREMFSKLVEGTYPNYKQVIPTNLAHAYEFDSASLKAAIHRVSLVANETVQLQFAKGRLTITGANADVGSGAESLALADGGKAEITAAFAPGYVIDALNACGDTATLGLTDGLSPMAVSADRFLAVVMPKRVS